MNFTEIQTLLLAEVKSRVSRGEITERALARITGYSQPHVHNVMKGVRPLSAEFADALLLHLRIDLRDLVAGDRAHVAGASVLQAPASRPVPLLAGPIGPGYPYPASAGPESYPFLLEDLAGLEDPLAARLAPDPVMADLFGQDAVVLLDCSEQSRSNPDDESLYAVELGGQGAIRRVRARAGLLYVADRGPGWEPGWTCTVPDRPVARIIRGRLRLLVRRI